MNVSRLWWELTKLVLTGRGRYTTGIVLANPDRSTGIPRERHDPVIRQFDTTHWRVTDVDWCGYRDRFVLLTGEPDDEHYYRKTTAGRRL